MGVKFEWHGDEAKDLFRERANRLLVHLLEFAVEYSRELTSTQGPPRSQPGLPPHRDKGPLHDLILYEVTDLLAGRFGTPAPEGLFTELGTGTMAARPWLRPTLDAIHEELERLKRQPMAEAG